MAMPLAAIVLGWNYREDSAECLDSILRTTYRPLQVWYVDNGSTDGAPEYLAEQFPSVKILALGENRGLVGGYNAGIEVALETGADYIGVFNNDLVVYPEFFTALVDAASAYERAGLLVPKILLYDDENVLWSAGARGRWFPPGIVQRGLGLRPQERHFCQVEPIEYATSCAWVMSSDMVHQVGLFDPRYPFYYSDYDYCKRVSLGGWQSIYVPSALARHKVSLSTQRTPQAPRWWRNMGEAESRFYRQYEDYAALALHVLWIVVRTVLFGGIRYIPTYVQGLRDGLKD